MKGKHKHGPLNCIFCGDANSDHNQEHVIPKWLLKFTGDHNRIWAQGEKRNGVSEPLTNLFKARSCKQCNSDYSHLEESCSYHIKALSLRKNIKGKAYSQLLDWLDKIRTGYWIHKKNLGASPFNEINFYINERVRKKDRILLVYPLTEPTIGLNFFGGDSFVFEIMPSVLAIRINNLLLITASTDFMLSNILGFPYPQTVKRRKNDLGYELSDFTKHKHFNLKSFQSFFKFSKPSIFIGQCIDQTIESSLLFSIESDLANFLTENLDSIEPEEDVIFGEVKLHEAKSLKDLIGEYLDFQLYLFKNRVLKEGKENRNFIEEHHKDYKERYLEAISKSNPSKPYLSLPPESYLSK